MAENDDDNDNSAVAILVNVLMKLEQLILEPFKVQIFWTQNQKHYSKATTAVLNLMYTQERGKRIKKKKMENPNMPITKCDLTNLCLQYIHKVHQYSFFQIYCHYHLWTKLVAKFSIIDRQHQQISMLLSIFIRCLILNCNHCYGDASGFNIHYYMLLSTKYL